MKVHYASSLLNKNDWHIRITSAWDDTDPKQGADYEGMFSQLRHTCTKHPYELLTPGVSSELKCNLLGQFNSRERIMQETAALHFYALIKLLAPSQIYYDRDRRTYYGEFLQ